MGWIWTQSRLTQSSMDWVINIGCLAPRCKYSMFGFYSETRIKIDKLCSASFYYDGFGGLHRSVGDGPLSWWGTHIINFLILVVYKHWGYFAHEFGIIINFLVCVCFAISTTTFTLVNSCNETIWPSILAGSHRAPSLAATPLLTALNPS